MDHTHLITAADLSSFAARTVSQGVIPRLVYDLIRASDSTITTCRIPYNDAVNQPGADGRVVSENGFFEFVPQGKSLWEIGTGDKPQTKATKEYTKWMKQTTPEERAEIVFVFVTPRSSERGGWNEPKQNTWLNKRLTHGWRGIRILDGVKLADWLRDVPALGRWMMCEMGLARNLRDITTPAEHWDNIQANQKIRFPNDPPLPPKIFLVGRENACAALEKVFLGETQQLRLQAESESDVNDFIAAYLASLDSDTQKVFANRCLFINEENSWMALAQSRASHVLVAGPHLDLVNDLSVLQVEAHKKNHAVIIPICRYFSAANHNIISIRSPSQSKLESAFTEAGYPPHQARELAAIGANQLSALKRHLAGLSDIPPYATWENARLLAQAGLIGQWNGKHVGDTKTLEVLLGKSYGEWIEIVREETLRPNTPLMQKDDRWKMLARGEAWNALGSRLTDSDLDHLKQVAVFVMGECDPKFDLPKEEHSMASIRGKVLSHSDQLREGMAETLALLGSRPEALTSCSTGKAALTADLTVRELLHGADALRWASLDNLLPLLAEASPDEFLDALESALENPVDSPFHQVFSLEGNSIIGGWNYTSGLLWALETLAWNENYLSRVTLILGDLASIDPGGQWSNRPSTTLTGIYLPWYLQTCAPLQKRLAAIEQLLKEQAEVGWKLLLALLPNNHGFSTGSRRPIWRKLIDPDWKEILTPGEYREQISAFAEIAVRIAQDDVEKLITLIERFSDMPKNACNSLLLHFESERITLLPEVDRRKLWDALNDLIRKHRRFSYTEWALPESMVDEINRVAATLIPLSLSLRHQYLFSKRDFDLFDEVYHGNEDYEAMQQALELKRQEAIQEILTEGGLSHILSFAQHVSFPYQVGLALGKIANEELESFLLPRFLGNKDPLFQCFIDGFVSSRFWDSSWSWVDLCLSQDWSIHQKAEFLILLPFLQEAWDRVDHHLGSEDHLYWKNARVNAWNHTETPLSVIKAIEQLLQYNRPNSAADCLQALIHKGHLPNAELVANTLLAVLDSVPANTDRFDVHDIVSLVKWLQENPSSDKNALFKIEWHLLPLLDRHSGAAPRTLEDRMASNPNFFCEVLRLVYRSKKSSEQIEEPSEHQRNLAKNAYTLLSEWKTIPGSNSEGDFDPKAFSEWMTEAMRLAKASGHLEIALSQIGGALIYAPTDPDGFWIHRIVADALNKKDANKLRSGFTLALFNERGIHGFTAGNEEREISKKYNQQAEELDSNGYTRFATAMRDLAADYERDAEREAAREPFED